MITTIHVDRVGNTHIVTAFDQDEQQVGRRFNFYTTLTRSNIIHATAAQTGVPVSEYVAVHLPDRGDGVAV